MHLPGKRLAAFQVGLEYTAIRAGVWSDARNFLYNPGV